MKLLNYLGKTLVISALSISAPVLAKAQTSTLGGAPASATLTPIEGVIDYADELRAVSYVTADGRDGIGIVAEDLGKYFPGSVVESQASPQLDAGAVSAILLALCKDLVEQNAHLNSQVEHLMYDKGDLERKLHDLTARVGSLEGAEAGYADRTKDKTGRATSGH